MSNDNQNLESAIASLTHALKVVEQRSQALDDKNEASIAHKNKIVADFVYRLLPAISNGVLRGLIKEIPQFVTPEVRDAFASNKKLLGIFKPASYDHSLLLLKTRLAGWLVTTGVNDPKFRSLREVDEEIQRNEAERNKLAQHSKNVTELLSALQRAYTSKTPLSTEAKRQVASLNKAAESANKARDRRVETSRSSAVSTSNHVVDDDYSDLWIWYCTDIPTSMRTLILDQVVDHERRVEEERQEEIRQDEIRQREEDEERRRSGGTEYIYEPLRDNDSRSDNDASQDSSSNIDTGSSSVGAVGGAVAAGAVAVGVGALYGDEINAAVDHIATDDSLGYFS